MAGVQEELWNIFTFYALRSSPSDFTRVSVTQFLRLARDCQIIDDNGADVDRGLWSRSGHRMEPNLRRCQLQKLGQAAVHLVFASILQGRDQVSRGSRHDSSSKGRARCGCGTTKSKLTYPEFLDALVLLGERMYCGSSRWTMGEDASYRAEAAGVGQHRIPSVDATFQKLLMEYILPFASRRRPIPVSKAMHDPLVRDLLRHFSPAFAEMFRFYAGSPSAAGRRISPACSGGADDGGTKVESGSMQPVAGPHVEEGAAKESEAISTEAGSCSIAPAVKDQDIVGWVDGAYIEDDGNVDCVTRDSVDSTQKARNSPPSCGTPSFSSSILATAMGTTPLQHNGGAWRVCASSNIGIQPPTVHRRTSKRAMNSMADAMSHRSLLSFASDFGISGAFLSALEVGEIFLSCDGCECLSDTITSAPREAGHLRPQSTRRTDLARMGKGEVWPLVFPEFLEALVRLSVACFQPANDRVPGADEIKEAIGPGHCLRALLTYMWRRLHDSVNLALNGVRAGETRHRSSIQKGSLLRGVQMFNDRMISRWRVEGFLDFATALPINSQSGVSLQQTFRYGHAPGILEKLLASNGDQAMNSEAH